MRREGACKRCKGDILEHGARAWCLKPTADGGCGGAFEWHESKQRWFRYATLKVGRIVDKKKVA